MSGAQTYSISVVWSKQKSELTAPELHVPAKENARPPSESEHVEFVGVSDPVASAMTAPVKDRGRW